MTHMRTMKPAVLVGMVTVLGWAALAADPDALRQKARFFFEPLPD